MRRVTESEEMGMKDSEVWNKNAGLEVMGGTKKK
jgi:hypothetical protein